MNTMLENLNVEALERLISPQRLKQLLPASASAAANVQNARATLRNILVRKDPRMFVVVGPCSIHDPAAAIDYARRLVQLAQHVSDTLFLVMRVYFEKPRTTTGWKGLINDPYLNDSFRIEDGLQIARQLMLDISEMGLPISTEALDPIGPQYLQDLVSWSAIGARTAESQTHREMASGLSSVVGFKNGTDGSFGVAINALQSVAKPHRFLGIDQTGQVSVVHTRGNAFAHIVLRGGDGKPNFDAESVARCEEDLRKIDAPVNIMIDCSHANSSKDPSRQPQVLNNVIEQIEAGNRSIIAVMLESNLHAGNQKMGDPSSLRYGVSITDACIDWQSTETALLNMAARLRAPLHKR